MINVIAIFLSDYANAYFFDKFRKFTRGGHLWMRIIGATSIGEAIFTITWIPLYFIFVDKNNHSFIDLFILAISNFSFKIMYSVLSAPLTSMAVRYIKNLEKSNTHNGKDGKIY